MSYESTTLISEMNDSEVSGFLVISYIKDRLKMVKQSE